MKISNTNTLGAKGRGLPYPVTLNPELYLSRTNGKFNKSTNGTIYVNEWIDPYSGLKATQDTGDYRPELVDDGVKFDGVDDVLTVGESNFNFDTKSFTFGCLVNFKLDSDNSSIIFSNRPNWTGGQQGFGIFYYNNEIWIRMCDGNDNLDTTVAVNDEQWHSIVGVWNADEGKIEMFVGGILVGSNTNANFVGVNMNNKEVVTGKDNEGDAFSGYLDEHVLYYKKLTTSQIQNYDNYTKQLKGIA
jgi:hypothetical protein